MKKNIKNISGSLNKITNLNAYSYSFNSDNTRKLPESKQIGLLAQEVEKEFPELVAKDAQGMLAVNYTALIPVMIDAIKDLKMELDETKLQLEETKLLLTGNTPENSLDKKSDGKYFDLSVHPNPTNDVSIIEYSLAENDAPASIVISNFEGRPVLTKNNLKAGKGKVEINTSGLKAGIYIYNLVIGNEVLLTKRIVVGE